MILDQFFQQRVVEIRHLLQKLGPRLMLALGLGLGHLHKLRMLAFAVAPCAFGNQVDRTDDLAVLADRNLAQDDRMAGIVLKRRDDVAHPALRRVHPVDEDEAGDRRRLDGAQPGRRQHRLAGIGRHAEDGRIGGQ